MGTTAARRGVGTLLAMAMALLPLALQPLPAAAAGGSGNLYSIDRSMYLVRIDPVAGTKTQVVQLAVNGPPPGPFGTLANLVPDAGSQRLFVIRTITDFSVLPSTSTSQVLTINATAATVAVSPDLVRPLTGYLAFDAANGSLFGVTGCCPSQVVRVDPGTGVETTVADVVGDSFSALAIDPASHTLFVGSISFATFPSTVHLLGVNTLTGAVTTSPVLARGFIGLVFDPSLHALLGVTFCCPASLVRIDPGSGAETTVADISGFYLQGSSATVDSSSHTVHVLNDVFDPLTGPVGQVLSINEQTGASVTGASLGEHLSTLAFLPVLVTFASLCALTRLDIETSPRFLSFPAAVQARWDQRLTGLCQLLASAQFAPTAAQKARLIKAYQAVLPDLVRNGLLTVAQGAELLTLSRAL